jgi:hypothetical protein
MVKKATRAAAGRKAQASRAFKAVKAGVARVKARATGKAVPAKTRTTTPANAKARAATSKARVAAKTRSVSAKAKPAAGAKAAPAPRPKPRPERAARPVAPAVAAAAAKTPNLDRPRKTVDDVHGVPSSLDMHAHGSAARTGQWETEEKLHHHTSTSPALTAGDVDADWPSADSIGDEAPGGDNPTPDQDVVEEIGRALGVEYHDDEELKGGDEIAERDRRRWELDPESSDDFEDR